jgi:tetratricopeptide (TPR) repeat protein
MAWMSVGWKRKECKMVEPLVSEYIGARATAALVDRKPSLGKIREAIEDGRQSYVIYITGLGGIGKTCLVRDVLRRCRPKGEWYWREAPRLVAAQEVVDFYHTDTHSIEGLTHAFWRLLGPSRGELVRYERKLLEFERRKQDIEELLQEVSEYREQIAEAFLADLNSVADSYRLVLALDTAERLLYDTGRIQQVLGTEGEAREEGIDVLPWLLNEFLPGLRNSVVLLAGRPTSGLLLKDLRRTLGDRLIELELRGFQTREDASSYFDAVVEVARSQEEYEIADRIAGMPPDIREVIWLYTGGRPILLSLMIDYLVVANELLPLVKVPVEEARSKTAGDLEEIADKIEADLVTVFQNTGRPDDEAIRILGWARRGLNAEMLAYVADMDVGEAEKTLERLSTLSFVKKRPDDDRYFAHDVFGEMLDLHVLAKMPKRRRDATYRRILHYYEKEIDKARKRVEALRGAIQEEEGRRENLLAPETPRQAENKMALRGALGQLYRLMPEEVFYRLRLDAVGGFRAHYVYRKEAYWTNDERLAMELRSEILQYLSEHAEDDHFNGLRRSDVELDSGLSWMERRLRRANYKGAVQIADDLLERCTDLFEEGDPLDRAQLDAYKGLALAYDSTQLDLAEGLLVEAIETFRSFDHPSSFQMWRRDAALADARNALGFLYRTKGLYRRAVAAYQQALPLWRSLAEGEQASTMRRAIEAQHANTLNNLSWALAWLGRYQRAEFACKDALGMRQELGPLGPIAFSLNTLGLIQIKNDHPREGRGCCEQALEIFRDLEQPRGAGLARIALAEALRRMASELDPSGLDRKRRLLHESRDHAREAVYIFTHEVKELTQLIQARIEQGCTYRDLAWVHSQAQEDEPGRRDLVEKGEDALRLAIQGGAEEPALRHLVIDAQVNLAWLYAYVGWDARAEEELREAIERVPEEYHITPQQGLPDSELPQSFLWVQMGKAHLLLGELAIGRYRRCTGEECLHHLEKAAQDYTLSLAYDELFAPRFRDMRRGMEHIYEALKKLNRREEFPAVYRGIDKAAEKYDLGTPTRMHQFLDESFGPLID